ncbi:hypothetical protein [Mycolicibacterium brisbanense]|uniref:hypothetical protein n=1 Tax=Mycolicibacterium brisbanense TaxID=146020 RepID=UPI0013F4F69E|nr:hypothetical protein [Mycolicibacterium brisbanense]
MDADNGEFWDDLPAHIRQRMLVPVIGPEVTVVDGDPPEQTLTKLIGQRLAEKYELHK